MLKKISDVIKNKDNGKFAGFFELTRIWKETVTKNIQPVTTPVRFLNNSLLVLVHDNIWLTELNYLKNEIIERLTAHGLDVKELSFKYSPVYLKHSKKKLPKYQITSEAKIYIEKMAENIDNEVLAQSFRNAMTAYFTRHTFEEFIHGK